MRSFDGEFVAGGPDDTRKKVTLMVAAMSQASFGERLRSNHAEEVTCVQRFADRRAGILAFLRKAEGIVRSVGGLSVKAGELFRCAFSHRCKYAELATADFSSAGVPGHNHLSKPGSEPFRA